jgi:hypothetical protein
MPDEKFLGRAPDCTCGFIECVCQEARLHDKKCRYRKALTCPIGIHCEPHGFDVCPVCDVCGCGGVQPQG